MIRRFKLLSVAFTSAMVLITAGCSGGGSSGGSQKNPTTPLVTVTPGSGSIEATQSVVVAIVLSGASGTPTGSVVLSSGTFTSSSTALSAGTASITIPADSQAVGAATIKVTFTPDGASSATYLPATGSASLMVTAAATLKPVVTVTAAAGSVTTAQSLTVTLAVSGTNGTPTGSIVLSAATYTSMATLLVSGSATITIPANSLTAGTVILTAQYTPDANSASVYSNGTGTANLVVTQGLLAPTVSVTPEESTHPNAENLSVNVAVSGAAATPTGSVVLSSGAFTSPSVPLNGATATFFLQPGSLAQGADLLTVGYSPDSTSSAIYAAALGTAGITISTPGDVDVTVNIDSLANRHQISPYIYGINTLNSTDVANLSPTLVRFGGNEASTYNWKLFTYNAGADWFFEDFSLGVDSVALTHDSVTAGSHMLTTLPMLNWVAKEAENGSNRHWSFSVATYGAECQTDPYNADAGNGQKPDCQTPVSSIASTSAYYPLADTASDCTTGNCLFRDEWVQAVASAFGGGACNVPYSAITLCHFYELDNEPEIWDGSHRDVHPVHPGYTELSNLFETDAAHLKAWDPSAVRFGPITCCWNFLWTVGPAGDDKYAHAGIDYVSWWLNRINWLDQIGNARSLDVFDVHSYVGANVSTTGYSNSQLRAAAVASYRTYWDPMYYNSSWDADWITTTQPNRGVTFLIPRLKALVNAIYPGTPLSFSEWESLLVPQSESDFATALADSDAYGVMGREGLSFSTRWGGPSATDTTTNLPHPNYTSFKLYTNYDGARHGFGTTSVADQSSANSDLFVSYAALDASGTTMTIMVLNKDPTNTAHAATNLAGFNATGYTSYQVGSTQPSAIVSSAASPWSTSQTFPPYSVTLLVVSGLQAVKPASEWYLNPDDLMIPASGTGTLNPKIMSGTPNVTLSSAVFDAFEGTAACLGSLSLGNPTITPSQPATITVHAGATPGFCHYTVTGSDGTATQTQAGWIIVGMPAGSLVQAGDQQSGSAGSALAQPLTVTFNPGQSGLSSANAEILFTASAGVLSNGSASGSKVIALTNSSGVASVTLILPSTKGTVTVSAQSQFAAGGQMVTFTETAD